MLLVVLSVSSKSPPTRASPPVPPIGLPSHWLCALSYVPSCTCRSAATPAEVMSSRPSSTVMFVATDELPDAPMVALPENANTNCVGSISR